MKNKIKLISLTILITAIPVLLISLIITFQPNDFDYDKISQWVIGIGSILCGIFVGIKLDDTLWGKISYSILTVVISVIIFSIVSLLPLYIILTALWG